MASRCGRISKTNWKSIREKCSRFSSNQATPLYSEDPGLNTGHFKTSNLQNFPSIPIPFDDPAAQQEITTLFHRVSLYGYHQWEVTDSIELIGGLAYDRLTYPENSRIAPILNSERTIDQVSPKAGFIYNPLPNTTVRFAYTRSLGGASIDQSFELEPSQVAGFIQSFRSIIPATVAGENAGAKFETFGLSLEQKYKTGTYLGVTGELLNSKLNHTVGAFDYLPDEFDTAFVSKLRENIDYREPSLLATVNQLVGRDWSLGAKYRISQAVANENFPETANAISFANFLPRQRLEAILNQVNLFGIFNHPCGVFAEGEAVWYSQRNSGFNGAEPGDDFWQFNAFLGYRFPRRRAEVTLGLLNISDQNYKLNPLNIYTELPRGRTLLVQFNVNF